MIMGINPERQKDYQETPYEDASWEVIDEIDQNPQFIPMELEVLRIGEFKLDPMFEDYGGQTPVEVKKLFHAVPDESFEHERVEDKLLAEIELLKKTHAEQLAAANQASYQEGIQAGRAEAKEQRQQAESMINDAVQALLQDMFDQVQRSLKELEERSVEFSLAVARKLLGTTVEINPEYVVDVIQQALQKAGTALVKKVRVSPEDFEFIEVLGVRKIIQGFDGSWDFEADATIHSGCVVDTSAGEIDFQLDKAWQRIADKVVRVIR